MKIERVIMLKALKAGDTVWDKGTVLSAPIPDVILTEIRKRTGTVKVLEQGQEVVNKPALVPKEKTKKATTTTTVKVEKKEVKIKKPKIKLVKRKKK